MKWSWNCVKILLLSYCAKLLWKHCCFAVNVCWTAVKVRCFAVQVCWNVAQVCWNVVLLKNYDFSMWRGKGIHVFLGWCLSQLATSGILASKNRIECYFGKLVFTSVILACSVFTSGILAILSRRNALWGSGVWGEREVVSFRFVFVCFIFRLWCTSIIPFPSWDFVQISDNAINWFFLVPVCSTVVVVYGCC